ncbi:MAG: PAS domain S-box protein [Acidobacteria bacterium]|nr:PAS domain S-box protein [Acidobacteriota bacterium]MBI3425004.1 PAS domain S-box protein [Acidobacteriota bacterium]
MLHQSPLLKHLLKRAGGLLLCLLCLLCLLTSPALALALLPEPGLSSASLIFLPWPGKLVWLGLLCLGMALYQSTPQAADLNEDLNLDQPFAKIFDDLPVPMALMRIRDRVFVSANQEFQRLTRLPLTGIVGKTHQQVGFEVAPAEQQRFYACILAQPRVRNYELTLRFSGHELVLLISSEQISFNGEPCLLGSFQNITARKLAEERFAKAFHANPVSMTIIRRRDYRIVETNPSTLKLTGLTRADMQDKTLRELNVEIAPATWQEINARLAATGQLSDYEFKVIYRGQERTLLAGAETIEFNGEPCILWSQQDITERKLAEERFAKAFYANPLPMCISRASDLRFIAVNESTLRFTGYTRAEMLGKTRCELGMVADEAEEQRLQAQLQDHQALQDFESNVTLQGKRHTLLVSVESIVLNGEPCWLWTSQDITERKRIEERFTKAFFKSPTPMTISRFADRRHLAVNDSYAQLTGVTPAELVGKTAQDLGFVVDPVKQTLFWQTLLETKSVRNFELEAQYRTGNRSLLVSAELLPLEGELSILWTLLDITERKQAEERFTKAFQAHPLPMVILRYGSHEILHANEIFLRRSRRSLAEVQGKVPAEIGFGIDLAKVKAITEMLRATGSVRDYELQTSYQGQELYFLTSAESMNLDGERCVLWSFQDITARKRAEAALQESQARLCMALEAAALGIWEHDLKTNLVYLDERAQKHFGLASGLPLAEIFCRIHPDDYEAARRVMHALHDPQTPRQQQSLEYRWRHPDGTTRWLRFDLYVSFAGEGSQRHPVRSIGTSLDITERKQAEEALRESEWRYRSLVEDQTEFVARWRPDGTRTFVNDSYCRFFGLPREKAIGTKWFPATFDETTQAEFAKLLALTPAQPLHQVEHLTRRKNGQLTWTHWSNRAIFDQGGHLSEFQSVGRDITERKQAEEIAQRWQSVFNQTHCAMAYLNARDNTFIDVNEAYAGAHGYRREELLGQPLAILYPPARRAELAADIQLTQQAGHRVFESTHVRKDGTSFPVFLEVTALQDAAGRPFARIVYARDITERKQAEEALRASELRYRQLVEDQLDFLVRWTPDGLRTFVNDSYCRFFGLPRETAIGTSWFDMAALAADDPLRQKLAGISPETPIVEWEHQCPAPDGSLAWTHWVNRAFFDEAGRLVEFQSVGRDVTARKQAEERFAKAFYDNAVPMSIVRADNDVIIEVNRAYTVLTGWSQEEALGRTCAEAGIQFSVEDHQRALAELRRTGLCNPAEFKADFKTGPKTLLSSASLIFFNGMECVLWSEQDITERKQAEEIAQRWQSVFSQTTFGLAHTNVADNTYLDVNEAYARTRGYTRAELIGQPVAIIYPPEERARIAQITIEIDRTGHAIFETVHQHKDGSQFPVLMEITVIRDAQGKPVSRISYTSDISERKKVEAALQASEAKFRILAETSQAAIFITDQERFLYANPAAEKIFGYTPAEMLQHSFAGLVHPDSLPAIQARYNAWLHGEPVATRTELKIVTKSGAPRWIESAGDSLVLNGRHCYLSTILDITERKQAEEALRASEAKFRALAETSQAAICIYDAQDTFIYANPASHELFGYTPAELTSRTIWDVIHPDSRPAVVKRQAARLRGETVPPRNEIKIRNHAGETLWVDYSIGQIEFAGRSCYVITNFDITERKHTEEELRISEERFAAAFNASPDAMAITTFDEGRFVLVNDAWVKTFGVTQAEALGQRFQSLNLCVDEAQRNYLFNQVRTVGPVVDYEVTTHAPEGQTSTLLVTAKLIKLGAETFVLSVSRDISERKRAEEELRISEERFAVAFNASPDAMAITTFDEGRFVLINDAWARIFGVNPAAAPGQQLQNLNVWMDEKDHHYIFNRVRTAGSVVDYEVTGRTAQGLSITFLLTAKLIKLGAETFVLSVIKDITERKRVEVELQTSQAQLRNLAGRLQTVREEERTAIAREIHDELGQALTGIKMDLKWLEQLLPPEAEPARERLTSVYSLIGNTVQSVRQLATSLRPGVLDDFGLVAALEWQARDFTKRTGIACGFDELPEELPLEPAHDTALFRIFQEALTNAARHAGASQINVRLRYESNALRLQIRDNGKGINADAIKHSRSLGLVGMRERALLLDGEFSIEGSPGAGTTINVHIPVAAHTQPEPLTGENTNDSHPDRR